MSAIMDLFEYCKLFIPQALSGLQVTLVVFSVSLVLSIPLGMLIAVCRLSKFKPLNKLAGVYITIMRGTPLLLQIIFIFFGLPTIGIVIPRMPSALLAFVLNYAAYFAEIFRAGISSIDRGQYEGSEVLGLSSKDTFFRIIFPQALKRVLPPVGNEVVTLVKDTALVYVIGFNDLLKIGKGAVNRDGSLFPLVIIAVIYLLLTYVLSTIMASVEKKYDYYQ